MLYVFFIIIKLNKNRLDGGFREGGIRGEGLEWRIMERGCEETIGTVRPDWICMRVVPLESPLKGHYRLYVFDFLISVLNI